MKRSLYQIVTKMVFSRRYRGWVWITTDEISTLTLVKIGEAMWIPRGVNVSYRRLVHLSGARLR